MALRSGVLNKTVVSSYTSVLFVMRGNVAEWGQKAAGIILNHNVMTNEVGKTV